MELHEFKVRHDTITEEWQVWVKKPLLFYWSYWQPVYKTYNFFYADPIFLSEKDTMVGIEKWKREHNPDYKRYETYHHKL